MKAILEDYKIYLFETARVKKTIESYLGNTRQLLEWLDDKDIDIDHLDRMIILKYLEHLEDKKYKVNTYNTKVNTIASFNNYLKEKGVIEKDIIFGKDKISLSRNREVDVYSDAEMKSIEAHIGYDTISQRDSLIIKMLKELGIRVSELTNLRLEDIDIVGLQVEVQGKNNKRRILPIKANYIQLINETSVFLSHFVPQIVAKCSVMSPAKAVPLHRISKRDEIESTNQLIN